MSNKKKILLCDDNPDQLVQLRNILKEFYEIVELTNYLYLVETVEREKNIHLVILDLVFDDSPVGHTILSSLYEKSPHVKVIIYSSLFDNPTSSSKALQIIRALNYKQVVGFLSPRDLPELKIYMIHRTLGTSDWIQNNEVWILHVSDPQFGGNGLNYDGKQIARKVWDCIEAYKRKKENFLAPSEDFFDYPDITVLTGDITEHARPNEFALARQFIQEIEGAIQEKKELMKGVINEGNIRKNYIAIPGNHDINWDISRSRSIFIEEVKQDAEVKKIVKFDPENLNPHPDMTYLKEYSWLPYCLLEGSYNIEDAWHINPGYKIINLKEELHLIFVCLNSSLWGVNHVENSTEIPQEIFYDIAEKLRKVDRDKNATRILLVHHTLDPYAAPKDRLIQKENQDDPKNIIRTLSQECGFSLILTGHVHDGVVELLNTGHSGLTLHNIGVGTLRSNDTAKYRPPQFNLIRLYDLSHDTGKFNKVKVYTFHWDNTQFKIDLSDEHGTKEARDIEIRYI